VNLAAPASGGGPTVVGRDPERGRVDAFIGSPGAGVRALVIEGEPGIGKTALWRYAIGRAREVGARILLTRADRDEVPLAFVGLTDLLQDEPEVADTLRDAEDAFARGRTILAALRRLSEAAPLVLAVDDLQWLDPGSAHALRFAIRRLDTERVAVVATSRSGPDDVDPLDLGHTLPPGRLEVLALGPLSLPDLRRVLSGVVDQVSAPILRRIHEVSGGNPLYAIELARGLPDDPSAGPLVLPSSLGAAIGRRLDAVPADDLVVMETLSALGPTLVDELRVAVSAAHDGAAAGERDGLDRSLARTRQAGLLLVDEDLVVRFTHPLLASAVYARMDPLSRRSLHAGLAAVTSDPELRARHLARSTDVPDEAVAALLEEAAARAGRRAAYDVAADLGAHSVRLTPSGETEARLRRIVARFRMLAAMGEFRRALALADELVAWLEPGRERAEVLIERAVLESDDLEREEDLLRRALDDAGQDQALRGKVLDQLGWLQGVFRGDLETGIANAQEALDLAVAIDDPDLRLSAACGLATMEALHGTPREAVLDEAVALERELGRPLLWGGPRVHRAEHLLWEGELDAARALFEAANAEAAASSNERWLAYGLYNLAAVECASGDLEAADRLVSRAMQTARDCEDAHVESWTRLRRAMVSAWLGRAEEARDAAARRLEEATQRGERPGIARIRTVLGILALSEGNTSAAVTELVEAARIMEESGYGNPGAIPAVPNAIEALAGTGDVERARPLLATLERQAAALDSGHVRALLARAQGTLLLATGEPEAAIASLDDASSAFDALGMRPDAARARLAEGRAWIRAGRRSRAAEVLADAAARFAGMGAALWEARAAEELDRVAPGRSTGELTPSERRIAELVAGGRQNREIAGTLFMSVATVEAHLTRLYRKLDLRSRSELARYMLDHGLVGPGGGATTEAASPRATR
jgi:ATP/maltotriose-dependent transcriptional regulator MalT